MIALRLFFVLCMVAIVYVRPLANAQDNDAAYYAALSDRLRDVLSDQGAEITGHRAPFEESMLTQSVWFRTETCAEEAVAMPFHIILSMHATLVMNGVEDWPHRVFYLGQAADDMSKSALLWRALRGKLQNVVVDEKFRGLRGAVVLAAPASCPAALDADLSTVWAAGE